MHKFLKNQNYEQKYSNLKRILYYKEHEISQNHISKNLNNQNHANKQQSSQTHLIIHKEKQTHFNEDKQARSKTHDHEEMQAHLNENGQTDLRFHEHDETQAHFNDDEQAQSETHDYEEMQAHFNDDEQAQSETHDYEEMQAHLNENEQTDLRFHEHDETQSYFDEDEQTQLRFHDHDEIQPLSDEDERIQSEHDQTPPDFQENPEIMDELMKLKPICPHLRRYSENIYDYAFSLYLYSAKCYRFILQTFPFPSVSSLYYHFSEDMNLHKEYICNIKYSTFLLDSYIEIFDIPQKCPCVIGGDATVASGNPMFKSIHANGCVYLYQMQTLFPHYPVLPLYLKLNASSKFTHENLNEMFKLRNVMEELGLICFSISTDGDNGMDNYHLEVFTNFAALLNEENEVIAEPQSAHPIIDLYHVLNPKSKVFQTRSCSFTIFAYI